MVDQDQTDLIDEELEKKRREFQDEISHTKPSKAPKKGSKRRLAFGITLLAILLVSLIIAAAYVLWFSPERAVSDAIVRALGSQTINFSGTITAGKTLDAQLNGAFAGSQGAKVTFNGRLDVDNKSNRFGTDAILDKDGNLYFSAGGIKSALGNDLVADAGNEGTYANLLLQKLEGKWLKVTSTELQPYNRKIANIQSCVEAIIKQNQGNGPAFQEAADIYQKNRFIIVDKILGVHGTSTGYGVHLDATQLKGFLTEFKGTVLYHQFHDCDSATFDLNPETIAKRFGGKGAKLELWINQAHEITEINTTTGLFGMQADVHMTPQFNQEAKIIVPSSTVNLAQLHEYLTDGTQALALAKKSDPTSKQLLDALKAKVQASN
jgi:hypothetical protein